MFAQDTPLSVVYDDFLGKKGFETQEIIPSRTSMEWEADVSTESIREVMEEITSIRIINTLSRDKGAVKALWKSISGAVERADYILMASVNSDGETINLYGLKHPNGHMHEFALSMKEQDEAMLITITGDIDMKSLFSGDIMKDMKKIGENFKGECPREL